MAGEGKQETLSALEIWLRFHFQGYEMFPGQMWGGQRTEAWTRKQLLEAMTRDDTIYLVAEMAGRIVGLCGVQNISGDGEITNVSVSGDVRRQGCGYKMMKQLLERGKGIGIKDYTLEVRAANASAIGLYEKLGFKSEGIRPGFYDEPKDDAAIYWKRAGYR